jgi:hypothetical protein
MEEKQFTERAARLEKIAKLMEKLPVEIRAAAFELVKGYVDGADRSAPNQQTGHGAKSAAEPAAATRSNEEDAEFFGKFNHDRAADNAKLIAANHYRKYGSEPFSIDDVRQVAADVGITIPDRVDMTFRAAKEDGHKLFTKAGRSKFKPTVHGETHLKAEYSITKGTKIRPKAAE